MTEGHSIMDQELKEYCENLIQCLVIYGKITEDEAKELVRESEICEPESEMDRVLLFHEFPYYWAMSLLHGKRDRYWHKDPALWPPPEEYLSPDWPDNII